MGASAPFLPSTNSYSALTVEGNYKLNGLTYYLDTVKGEAAVVDCNSKITGEIVIPSEVK